MTNDDLIHALDRDAAWARLGTVHLGRLATSLEALPVVVPVHFLTADARLVFALAPDSALARSIDGTVFAFEASGHDDDGQRWWTVHVRGTATSMGLRPAERDGFTLLDPVSSVLAVSGDAQLVRGAEVDSLAHLPSLSDYLARAL